MNDDFEIPSDKDYSGTLKKIALGGIVLFISFAAYLIFNNLPYLESSIGIFALLFIIANLLFYFSLTKEIISLIIVSVVFIGSSFLFISNSIDWRKNYIENGFLLEAYIDTYPTYVDHLQASIGIGSDIVSFTNECLEKDDKKSSYARLSGNCKSFESVQEHYGVDLKEILISYHTKMKRTAEAISKDQVKRIRYPGCINKKTCAYIPLPPKDMTPEEIENSTDPSITVVRDGFWELVDQASITPNICQNMFLCRRLKALSILDEPTFRDLIREQTRKNRRR